MVRYASAVLTGMMVTLGSLLGGPTMPAYAQFSLYDDFTEGPIDGAKWSPLLVDSSRVYEIRREISEGQLLLGLRVYSRDNQDTGTEQGSNILRFREGSFTAVQFDATVPTLDLFECKVAGSSASLISLEFHANLFNDGSREAPRSRTGDVEARLRIIRRSTAPKPVDVVETEGIVFRCGDPDCIRRATIGRVTVGDVVLGESNTFAVIWNEANSSVDFQKKPTRPVSVAYTQSVVERNAGRMLLAQGQAGNCTQGLQPFAHVNGAFDNIFVSGP